MLAIFGLRRAGVVSGRSKAMAVETTLLGVETLSYIIRDFCATPRDRFGRMSVRNPNITDIYCCIWTSSYEL